MRRLDLIVNGERRRVLAAVPTSLADLLRDDLGLKGTHVGCAEGVCGSCTVLVDGRSVRSCLMLAIQADGADVTTIEGFAARPDLAAVGEAFVRHFAAQCGFCTPGMMAVVAELLADQSPGLERDEAAIRARLDAVICRCTGYQAIVEAVRALLKDRAGDVPPGARAVAP